MLGKCQPDDPLFYYVNRDVYDCRFPKKPKVPTQKCHSQSHRAADKMDKLLATQEMILRRLEQEHNKLRRKLKQNCKDVKTLKEKIRTTPSLEEPICENIANQEEKELKEEADIEREYNTAYDELTKMFEIINASADVDIENIDVKKHVDEVNAIYDSFNKSERVVIDLCPLICEVEEHDENYNNNFNVSTPSLNRIDDTFDSAATLATTPSFIDTPELPEDGSEEENEDINELEEASSVENQAIYCIERNDGCKERLKRLIIQEEIEQGLIDRRMVELEGKIDSLKQLKRCLLNNVLQMRRQLREVSFQMMDMKVTAELWGVDEPFMRLKQCKSAGKKRCKI